MARGLYILYCHQCAYIMLGRAAVLGLDDIYCRAPGLLVKLLIKHLPVSARQHFVHGYSSDRYLLTLPCGLSTDPSIWDISRRAAGGQDSIDHPVNAGKPVSGGAT